MRNEIQIGSKVIGDSREIFLIAEVGVTCNYDMGIAKELIDATRDAGADAVKFIFWFPDEIMADRTITYTYATHEGARTENMYRMLSRLRFSLNQWKEIKRYADRRGVVMFSTVNSPSGIRYARALRLEAFKLSSWDFNDLPMWRRIAEFGKPMLIDTGPVNTLDVAKVMQLMKESGNDQSVLFHCHHTERYDEYNMRSIPYLRQAFNTLVGYSSTDTRDEPDILAVALGASVVEKRLTMSRKLPGHHHVLSKEPKEFKSYVRMIRDLQSSLGAFDLRPSPNDLKDRKKWFRHLVANRNLRKGTRLTRAMIASKRGETDISPEFEPLLVGRALRRDLRENQAIRWSDV